MKNYPFVYIIVAFFCLSGCVKNEMGYAHIKGQTMGTIEYNVKFQGNPEGIGEAIAEELERFNQSLSTYIPDSEISELNSNSELTFRSKYFYPVLNLSKKIYQETSKTYDPSIGPLVKAWGFGPGKKVPNLSQAEIDSLLGLTGFDQVTYDSVKVKTPVNFNLDFSAIAKGYAVDLVAEILEQKGFENYLVEIGGELRARGVNEKKKSWSIGIEDPTVDLLERKLLAVVRIKDQSLATSGNYRNYYEEDGKIYAHIIDPRTGYNSKHNLLSVSVFADDCISADAYATAFMVLGIEDSKRIIESQNLEAFLIYRDENGDLKTEVTDGLKPFIQKDLTL